MASVLQGVLTDLGRQRLAKSLGAEGGFDLVKAVKFAYGEGGFTVTGSGRVPKVPNPGITEMEAGSIVTPLPPADNFRYEKFFTPADITFIAPFTIQFRCKLNPSEANLDLDTPPGPPKFFELGLYDAQNNLIAYTTFDEQTKTATKSLITFVQVVF